MPSSRGSKRGTKGIVKTQKRKASKVVKGLSLKKKRKGPTGDTISLSSETIDAISSNSGEPSIVEGITSQTDVEEGSDVELGTLPFNSCNNKNTYHYVQNV